MASKNITARDQRRFDIMTYEVGCICCRLKLGVYVQAEANHHLKGYRIGHHASTPECPWHHQGTCLHGISARAMRRTFGPSRRLHKKAFRKEFGTDEQLLEQTNKYIDAFEANTIGGDHRAKKEQPA